MESLDIATLVLIIWCVVCWMHAAKNLIGYNARALYAITCNNWLNTIIVSLIVVFLVVTAPVGTPLTLIKRAIKAND